MTTPKIIDRITGIKDLFADGEIEGGELIEHCDKKIHVKTKPGEYGPVEDAHLIMNHVLAHWFQNKLK